MNSLKNQLSDQTNCIKRVFKRIGLLNHIGSGNLGDDATVKVVIRNITKRLPDAEISIFSMNPEDTIRRHGLKCYPLGRNTWAFGYTPPGTEESLKKTVKAFASKNRFLIGLLKSINALAIRLPAEAWRELLFLARSFKTIRSLDVLIVSGGGQLTEKDGPWAFPYTLFKWIMLAKAARAKCIFLNVGAGPLAHPLSKFFVTRALIGADYVSFRDLDSQMLAVKIGFTGESHVFPDSVYSLDVPGPLLTSSIARERSLVGVAPMPYCDPRFHPAEQDQTTYKTFIEKLAIFTSRLKKNSYGFTLFGTDIGVDPLAIEDLQTVLRRRYAVSARPCEAVDSIEKLVAAMSAMDYVVTCRFHGVVLAYLLGKPVMAIAPHPKVTTLMNDLGLSEYCVDIREFDPNDLADTFGSLVKNSDAIKARMSESLAGFRMQLSTQFDDLFLSKVSRVLHDSKIA